ncbi:hypothetical protein BJ322DRAFT_1111513 [Thelephora terrestris]|uniref:RING-type domain-containing protein n=1 Tax=Thelephora terrestris TaxID=56493 RepID=A0A9P6HAC1_9AGAM|nr:hypothetical protein BJ322DRAFT_1111513 [Thelephora terrestris]
MSSSQVLSEEFAAIMHRVGSSTHQSRASPGASTRARYGKTIPSQTRKIKSDFHARGENKAVLSAGTLSDETDPGLSALQKKCEALTQRLQVLGARFEDCQKKLHIAEGLIGAHAELHRITKAKDLEQDKRVREMKDKIKGLKEKVRSAETRSATLSAETEAIRNEATASKSELQDLRTRVEESVICGVCQGTLNEPYSTECRHIFCAACLITWWHASGGTSCPSCRRVSTQLPVRDHSHETLIEAVRATSGEVAEVEPLPPLDFAEFFEEQDVEEMDTDDMDYQLSENEEPSNTIDLTGIDD